MVNTESKKLCQDIQKCVYDQFTELQHSRITNENNVMYQLFKIFHGNEIYIAKPFSNKKHYSSSEWERISYLLIIEKNAIFLRMRQMAPFVKKVY